MGRAALLARPPPLSPTLFFSLYSLVSSSQRLPLLISVLGGESATASGADASVRTLRTQVDRVELRSVGLFSVVQ